MKTRADAVSDSWDRRGGEETSRERRSGRSRLATWSARKIALSWIAWPLIVLVIVALGTIASVMRYHGTTEIQVDLTVANLRGLVAVAIIPPACLTLQWLRMRGRRRERQTTQGSSTNTSMGSG